MGTNRELQQLIEAETGCVVMFSVAEITEPEAR
jgi:hypothetical protein